MLEELAEALNVNKLMFLIVAMEKIQKEGK